MPVRDFTEIMQSKAIILLLQTEIWIMLYIFWQVYICLAKNEKLEIIQLLK